MTKDEAIQRIQLAISELEKYSASQNQLDDTTTDEAIMLLDEVIEAIEHRRIEYLPFAA
jgi:hypothetical protein